jgi:hypothetical protein
MAIFACLAGLTLVVNLCAQLGLGYSPLKAGLMTVPYPIGMVLGMGIAQSVKRFGRCVLHAGAVVNVFGVLGVLLTIEVAGPDVTPWQMVPALTITGLGCALLMGPYFDFVLAGVEPHETGSASGTLTAVQQLGAAVGVALLGTVFFGVAGPHQTTGVDLAGTTQTALWAVTGLLLVTFLVGFLLPRQAQSTTPQSVNQI